MRDSGQACLIGVDGGGTSCRIGLLLDGVRHELRLGGANVSSDPEGALARISEGLARLADRAGVPLARLEAGTMVLCLAGVTGPGAAARVRSAFPNAQLRVTDDRESAVAGALGAADGTVASLGTGSFVARRTGGVLRGIGGWGWVLGDEASGAWLGRRMLGAALRTLDGLEDATPLTAALIAEYGGAAGVVDFGFRARPAEFGAMAPRMIAAAEAGDSLARRLLAEGGDYVGRAVRVLGWRPGEPLVLMGGLGPQYGAWLPPEMQAALLPRAGSALDGALSLALDLAQGQGLAQGPEGGA